MRNEQDIYLNRTEDIGDVDRPGSEPGIGEAVTENKVLNAMSRISAPPPDRMRMILRTVRYSRSAGVKERVMKVAFRPAFSGRSWYFQAAAVVVVALLVLAVFSINTVRKSNGNSQFMLATPAWAAELGYIYSQEFGIIDPAAASKVTGEIESALREFLKDKSTGKLQMDSELKCINGAYTYKLALPGIDGGAAREALDVINGVLAEYQDSLGETSSSFEDVMFLLEASGANSISSDWKPLSEMPDAAQLEDMLKQMHGDHDMGIDIEKIGDQIALKLLGEDVELIGPSDEHDGRDVMLLREAFAGEPTVTVTASTTKRSFSTDENGGTTSSCSSYSMSASSARSYSSSSSSDGQTSISSDGSSGGPALESDLEAQLDAELEAMRSRLGNTAVESDRPGRAGTEESSATADEASEEKKEPKRSSAFASGGGGGGGFSGGGGSGGGGGTTSSDGTSSSYEYTSDDYTLPEGMKGPEDLLEMMKFGEGYEEHQAIFKQFIKENYPNKNISVTTNLENGEMYFDVEYDGEMKSYVIRKNESGEVALMEL